VPAPQIIVHAVKRSGDSELFPLGVKSLIFTDEGSKVPKIKLVVNNGDLRLFTPPASKYLVKGMVLAVRWGYPGRWSRKWAMVVEKATGFRQVTIEGYGKKILAHGDTRTRTWENVLRSDVAREIAQDLGYPEEMIHVEGTDEVLEHLVQSQKTDAQFLGRLAELEGFEFWMDPGGFHWRQRPADQVPRKVYVYQNDRHGQVMGFKPKTDVLTLPARVVVKSIDPRTKQAVEAVADNETVTDLPGTGGFQEVGHVGEVDDGPFSTEGDLLRDGMPAPMIDILHDAYGVTLNDPLPAEPAQPQVVEVLDAETGEFVKQTLEPDLTEETGRVTHERVIALPGITQKEAERRARGAYQRARQQGVKAELELEGDPSAEARTVIMVQVPGVEMFSKAYYVEKCTHKVGPGMRTTLGLNSEGLGRAAGSAKVKAKGKAHQYTEEELAMYEADMAMLEAGFDLVDGAGGGAAAQQPPALVAVEYLNSETGEFVTTFVPEA